jgi:phage/plasmid-like protein (TIGR03299 family)
MPAEVQTMFSVGEVPWHGLGHVLDTAPSCADALTLAGLDWRVGLRPMMSAPSDGGPLVPVPGARAVWRQDTGTILGTVGDDFEPLQNAAAFGVFEPLVAEGLITLETAGALREGRRVWIMARVAGDPEEIVSGDIVDRYLLLCHGHDGSLALRLGFNSVRVVCSNTLGLALDKGEGLFTLRHTSGLDEGLARARTVIHQQIAVFKDTAEGWRLLAARSCSDADFAAYVLRVLAQADGEDHGHTVGKRLLETIKPLYEAGVGNDRPGVRGTWWAAYNAITQWLTHHRGAPIGTESERAARRFEALHLGPGRRLGVRALLLALDAAERAPMAESAPLMIAG